MKIEVKADERLSLEMAHQVALAEVAVTRGIASTSNKIKGAWRDEVRRALGQRLSQAIRSETYPQRASTAPVPEKGKPQKTRETSLDAAALVYARPGKNPGAGAAAIIAGHENGAVIRSNGSAWLAIPTEEARAARLGRQKLTPTTWQQRTGIKLQVVIRPDGTRLLVAVVRESAKTGRFIKGRVSKRGRFGEGTFTSVMFLLVPQVRLRKRLNLMSKADRLAQDAPQAIVRNWPR